MAAKYREEWLNDGLSLMRKEIFTPLKYDPPSDIRVSCGFPSSKALALRRQTIGQCWYPTTGGHELFITPLVAESVKVLDIMAHEVVHTLAGKEAAHKAPFAYIAKRIGLTGKMTATVAGPKLKVQLVSIVKRLGDYPHKPITPILKQRAANSTKYVAGECDYCGYSARIPEAFYLESGFPICPACEEVLGEMG